jgi:hypothetical protein
MPKLVRLYLASVALGFALSAVFLALLVLADVAGLRHLIWHSDMGALAGALLFVMNGVIFAGVQFGIAIMRLSGDGPAPRGGLRAPHALRPAMVKIVANPPRQPRR